MIIVQEFTVVETAGLAMTERRSAAYMLRRYRSLCLLKIVVSLGSESSRRIDPCIGYQFIGQTIMSIGTATMTTRNDSGSPRRG
jgi:hypothetical protein